MGDNLPASPPTRYQTGNDFGGRVYTEEEQDLLMQITVALKERDREHRVDYDKNIRPKHYMFMYTKAAASLYELSKALSVFSGTTVVKPKSIVEWLRIFTGKEFHALIGNIPEEQLKLANPSLLELKSSSMEDTD